MSWAVDTRVNQWYESGYDWGFRALGLPNWKPMANEPSHLAKRLIEAKEQGWRDGDADRKRKLDRP